MWLNEFHFAIVRKNRGRELEKKVAMLDARQWRRMGAIKATLSIMVVGDEAVFADGSRVGKRAKRSSRRRCGSRRIHQALTRFVAAALQANPAEALVLAQRRG